MNQTVTRALDLLIALEDGARTLDECAERLGVHKSTVLRLLQTLEAQRFVTHDAQHRYRLGSRLFDLAGAALAQRDVREVARPHLERLNDRTGQTVHLAAYESGDVVYIDKLEARTGIRMYSRVGLRAPLHSTAVAKVLLADLPVSARRAIAEGIDYVPYTERTIANPADFLAELERVRADDFARDSGEHESFINCIAAPIRDGSGAVVAAASVSVPTMSLPAHEVLALLPQLVEATQAASADLGWAPRPAADREERP
ncbi:IclR family transcriptional regulator [Microbacterium sp. NPDC089698]|jgi:DNA-binding IclR family transcriptional regulator|uniref:IclR family transcriptional regulator n=1 Tax=unclassified Microbacterium TaxID=2609290 RepID=UPI00282BDDE0|nr:IclR family transcriptional regulator [Microbacterium sp.]MDR2321153.1 IclR family transcriptional regulator [Microbacterium sp.]